MNENSRNLQRNIIKLGDSYAMILADMIRIAERDHTEFYYRSKLHQIKQWEEAYQICDDEGTTFEDVMSYITNRINSLKEELT